VGDARLVERADDLGKAEGRGTGAVRLLTDPADQLVLELGVGRANPLGDDGLDGRKVESNE
jgi:hypothetical protein